jgi:hypothetical protein
MVPVSIIHDSLWNWAEYLRRVNVLDGNQQLYNVVNPEMVNRDRTHWIASLISAMIGKPQPANLFLDCGTLYDKPFDQFFSDISIKVDITNETDAQIALWGWTRNTIGGVTTISINQPVAPSGLAIVVGQKGSLLDDTPLSAEFTVKRPVADHGIVRRQYRTDWYNTWAMGTVMRFNGYDLNYTLGSDMTYSHRRVLYAANNVQVAVPPVLDVGGYEYAPYRWFGPTERQHVCR